MGLAKLFGINIEKKLDDFVLEKSKELNTHPDNVALVFRLVEGKTRCILYNGNAFIRYIPPKELEKII